MKTCLKKSIRSTKSPNSQFGSTGFAPSVWSTNSRQPWGTWKRRVFPPPKSDHHVRTLFHSVLGSSGFLVFPRSGFFQPNLWVVSGPKKQDEAHEPECRHVCWQTKTILICHISNKLACETPWLHTLRWHSCRTPLLDTIARDTLAWHSCKTLLTWHSCKTPLLDILVRHSSLTLLFDILVRHSYLTILWDRLTSHSYLTLL